MRIRIGAAALLTTCPGLAAAQSIVPGDLVALSSATNTLYEIDKSTGAATLVTATANPSGTGLASLGTKLMATDITGFPLAQYVTGEVDPVTGSFTPISDQGGDINWHALAADQVAGVYYTSANGSGGALVRMTPTGVLTQVGSPMPFMRGMAFDHAQGVLYGASGTSMSNSFLYRIDPATGIATMIGPTIDSLRVGLAFDDATGTLYGINSTGLYTLDTGTGAGTFVGGHGLPHVGGLAIFSPSPPPPPDFSGAPASISLAAGGTQTLSLDAGSANAGAIYLVLGTTSGTAPGQILGPVTIPLNADGYFVFTLTAPNQGPLVSTLGLLDGAGQASASVTLPAGSSPGLAGITAHHAYVLFGSSFVSDPVPLSLVP